MTILGPIGHIQPFSVEEIEQMHHAALRVLHELGLEVANAQALGALEAAGVRVAGGRAHFEPEFVEQQLASIKHTWVDRPRRGPSDRLTLGIGDMCQYYHSPFNDEIELMSTADAIEATKCVETMRDVGIGSYVPGVPRDVPQQLQAIVEYRIGSEYLTGHPTLDTLHPPEALPYLLEMAEAMGRPMESAGIFTVSPLRLAGYEFDIAIQHAAAVEALLGDQLPRSGGQRAGAHAGCAGSLHRRSAWRRSDPACDRRWQTGALQHRHVPLRSAHVVHGGRHARDPVDVLVQRPGEPLLRPIGRLLDGPEHAGQAARAAGRLRESDGAGGGQGAGKQQGQAGGGQSALLAMGRL